MSQSSCKELNKIVPFYPNNPYDMKIVIENILQSHQFYEIMPDYAKNKVKGLGKSKGSKGRVVGIVAIHP
jgi:propionyl-CoA carboxylase beta chain